MVSDAEILVRVCRIISENIENPPKKIDQNTVFEKMVYKWDKAIALNGIGPSAALKKKPTIHHLIFDVVREYYPGKQEPYWFFPEYFDFDKTYKKVKSVKDICKLIRDGYTRMEEIEKERKEEENNKIANKEKFKNVELIDLDWLLNGDPTWEQVQKFFLEGEFHDERYLVDAIKLYLRTPQQKSILDKLDVSIENTLNGRTKSNKKIDKIYKEWNDKLGFKHFGVE